MVSKFPKLLYAMHNYKRKCKDISEVEEKD